LSFKERSEINNVVDFIDLYYIRNLLAQETFKMSEINAIFRVLPDEGVERT
jgi:hypothetical protein